MLAETPFFDDGALHWMDVPSGRLHISPEDAPADGSGDRVLSLPAPVPCLQPADGGGWVAALRDRVVRVGADGRVGEELARLDLAHDSMRLNEGKVDPQGRLFLGGMDKQHPDADWYRVGASGSEVSLHGFSITNGLEWSLDERTVYLADTAVQTLYRAPWHPETGPGDLAVHHAGAAVDGAALDEEGCLWTAVNGEGLVLRLDPDGQELERVAVPAPGVTGVCFGGASRSTLFVCSGTEGMSEQQVWAAPLSGGVFAIETAVHGRPLRRFRAA